MLIYSLSNRVLWAVSAVMFVLGSLGYALTTYRTRGLASVPGPWLAKVTNLWRLQEVFLGRFYLSIVSLHEKHGDLVRIGPNCVSIGDPLEIKTIYGITRLFPKSDFYIVPQSVVNGKRVASLFMMTDEQQHKDAKRPIAHAYAMSTLLDYEPFVDTTSTVFLERLSTLFAGTGKICDFGQWLQWYAFDVIGEMTFSQRLGFLERGEDVRGIIQLLHDSGRYVAVVGQMPWLDYVLDKNPVARKLSNGGMHGLIVYVMDLLQKRLSSPSDGFGGDAKGSEKASLSRKDFVSKFADAIEKHHGKIPQSQLLGWSMSNINAGSDTTAIALRAIFDYLLRTPRALSKLQAEFDTANLSPLPQWRETCTLPYLGAVVKEALRIHPAVGLNLERVIPEGGVTLCGQFIAEGTIVGCNPVVIHKNKSIYGLRYPVDEFWPERWIEADEAEKATMDRCYLAFGSGKRTCIGKNISLLEIYKVVPLLLTKFKFRLAFPERKLKLVCETFFMQQKGLDVIIEAV